MNPSSTAFMNELYSRSEATVIYDDEDEDEESD
jgi:hypothetical protein